MISRPAKFLLVNPMSLKKNILTFPQPQSLGYLATALRHYNHEVHIIDAAKDKVDPEKLALIVKSNKFDVVGFYLLSPILNSLKTYSELIKKYSPNTMIIVGGPHPTFEPIHTLRSLKYVDFACIGDGEETLPKVLSKPPDLIPNLAWKSDSSSVHLPKSRIFSDINKFPLPAWDLLKPDTYPPTSVWLFSEKKRIAQIITTRGCSYPCSFCGVPFIAGKMIRTRKIDFILQEIDLLVSKYKIEEIHIIDDNLTMAPKKWLISLLEEISKANFPVVFSLPSGIRIDLINEQILELLWKARFRSFALGIESANQSTLDKMQKKLKIEKVIENMKLISKYDFYVQGNFILGYPTEGLRENLKTIFFARSLPIQKAIFSIFNPFPGTKEWDEIKKEYPMEKWDEVIESFNLYSSSRYVKRKIPRWLLKVLQVYAYFTFFIRPKIFFGAIKRVKSLQQMKAVLRSIFAIMLK